MIQLADVYNPMYLDKDKMIILVTGGRGCETPTQEIMMADLTVKMIKDIRVGERVMGDDFTPRTVLATMQGRGMMYRVHQSSGEDYLVNESHILTVRKSHSAMSDKGNVTKQGTYKRPNGRYPQYPEFTDINVLTYAKSSKHFRDNFRGYKAGSIPYAETPVKIEPYLLGVWLGDGTSIYPQITTPDPEIKEYLQNYADTHGFVLSLNGKKGKAETLRIAKKNGKENAFLSELRSYGLLHNKHIPQSYISNSESVRLELLAGLLDTDGSMSANGYEIIQKSKVLALQIKFIADTLGFRTNLSPKKSKIGDKDCGIYYRIHINGDVWRIPCKVERKKVTKDMCRKNKDWRLSQLTITPHGKGEWCGISLDGNQRYLHADGTVTHNSGKSFATGAFIERLTFEAFPKPDNPDEKITHTILYTRYTMVSANISVIPEMMEKIELDGVSKYFSSSRGDVRNILTGAKIMFRGIHTSSGNQTAKLKSIHGITTFVVDEAEEWTSEAEFDKIMLSIRQKGIKNRIIIIMNPTDSNHFVYRRFIKDTHKVVDFDGVPVQISTHPNVLHIHTTYLDNIKNLSEDFIKETERIKAENPEKYAHTVMGQWADVAEGAVFKNWGIVDKFPDYAKKIALGVDFGYSCFSGDTLITTTRGLVPIKDITESDYVLTRQGYRKVLKKLDNGIKTTFKKVLQFSDKSIVISATNEHNFNANGTWKKYGQLTKGDRLCTLSNLTGLSIEDTRMVSTLITTITGSKNYTEPFMSFIRAKFREDTSSTTLIKILSITISKIWSLLHRLNTAAYTTKKLRNSKKFTAKWGIKTALRLRIGTKDAKKLSAIYNLLQELAPFVERNLLRQTPISGFAQSLATINGNIKHPKTMLQWSVDTAEKLIWAINTTNLCVAATSAPISCCGLDGIRTISRQTERVYDLTIDGVHEYFANGVLVHNCDQTAIVKCGIIDNRLYIQELCYKTHMLVADIIEELKPYKGMTVICDSADPRLIQEIFNAGILIYPVIKGGGSILAGIEKMKDMEMFVTKDSLNLQHELRNYVWDRDKDGNYINKPVDRENHLIDSARYWVLAQILGQITKPVKYNTDGLGIF